MTGRRVGILPGSTRKAVKLIIRAWVIPDASYVFSLVVFGHLVNQNDFKVGVKTRGSGTGASIFGIPELPEKTA